MKLSSSIKIEDVKTEPGSLSIFWLSQAGFVFKDSEGRVVCIDPYFSDVVERTFGFKRMMSCPVSVEEIVPDVVICTHEHLDHMDTDALPTLVKNSRTHFVGPTVCWETFRTMGVPETRRHLLEEGKELTAAGLRVAGVYADHGEYAPDALGVVVDFPDARVYHTGDTAYRPKEFAPAIAMEPDVLLPCINGRFGNMNRARGRPTDAERRSSACDSVSFLDVRGSQRRPRPLSSRVRSARAAGAVRGSEAG